MPLRPAGSSSAHQGRECDQRLEPGPVAAPRLPAASERPDAAGWVGAGPERRTAFSASCPAHTNKPSSRQTVAECSRAGRLGMATGRPAVAVGALRGGPGPIASAPSPSPGTGQALFREEPLQCCPGRAGPLRAGCLRGSGAQTQAVQVIVLRPEAGEADGLAGQVAQVHEAGSLRGTEVGDGHQQHCLALGACGKTTWNPLQGLGEPRLRGKSQ